jgi:hypothetical protein
VKHLNTYKRQFGFLLLGLTLALSVIIPLAVGATNPAPVSVNCSPQCLWLPPTPTTRPDPNQPVLTDVETGRYYPYPAVSPVWVHAYVQHATSVDLIIPGNVTLLYHTETDYLFEVTGLIPYGHYAYEVDVHGVVAAGPTTATYAETLIA